MLMVWIVTSFLRHLTVCIRIHRNAVDLNRNNESHHFHKKEAAVVAKC